ncbi:inositol monophosphatase family protein [Tropicimonas sp.]|uniref:inositol monophosphatase family protein n=1 Tax=Tropicimonas sp. TaxID=2067044 RepID=UPI003A89F27F
MVLTDSDLAARLDRMGQIAREAGALALRHFRNRDGLEIETKRVLTDMVSVADREVERFIREALLDTYSDDGFLGEEYGLILGGSGLTWVVDPIDGTAPFLTGLPGWCVSIGLMDEEGPLLGAIFAPVLDELFLGGRGLGVTLNGKPAGISQRFDLSNGLLGVGSNDRASVARVGQLHRDLADRGVAWVRYGSGALMIAYVAAGRLVGYCEPRMSLWDCLAAYALVEAAGGRVLPVGAGALHGRGFGVLAATPDDYDRLVSLTRFESPEWDAAAS